MSSPTPLDRIGVGIDTARYGHRVSFLRPDRQSAAKPMTVLESRAGYQALHERLEQLHHQHPQAHFHIRIDAAGQYAANLEHFLRGLPLPLTLSIGEPKRNKDYQKAHFPKRTTDDTESQAMARFAVVELPNATADMTMLREVVGRLQAKVKQSTQAINRLHNLVARVFPELANLTDDLSASWVLRLLDKYPTAQRIGQARLTSLQNIPYLAPELAEQLHLVAQQSVACLSGTVAETLVRDLAAQVRHTQQAEEQMRDLLSDAYAALPEAAYRQVVTIPGIGVATAAVLIAQTVDINRFATPEHFVGYFGVFPEENSSGVDKFGNPVPPGTLRMSPKGNDLVRSYLWNAARSAIVHNPAIGASIGVSKPRANAATSPWASACVNCSIRPTPSGRPIAPLTTNRALGRRPTPTPRLRPPPSPPLSAATRRQPASSRAPPPRPVTRAPNARHPTAPQHLPATKRPWATNGTCPRNKWSPRPTPR